MGRIRNGLKGAFKGIGDVARQSAGEAIGKAIADPIKKTGERISQQIEQVFNDPRGRLGQLIAEAHMASGEYSDVLPRLKARITRAGYEENRVVTNITKAFSTGEGSAEAAQLLLRFLDECDDKNFAFMMNLINHDVVAQALARAFEATRVKELGVALVGFVGSAGRILLNAFGPSPDDPRVVAKVYEIGQRRRRPATAAADREEAS